MSDDLNKQLETLLKGLSSPDFKFNEVGDFAQKNLRRMLCHSIFPRPFERFAVRGNEKPLTGVEIGVFKGEHALSLLTHLNMDCLFLVDPYLVYKGYEPDKLHGIKEEEMAKKALDRYAHNITWVKKFSSDAAREIPNELDFVYVDGNHSYDAVKQDIELYYPKLRRGGVIGGHDMFNSVTNEHDGVVRAFTEFSAKNNLRLCIDLPDCWIEYGRSW